MWQALTTDFPGGRCYRIVDGESSITIRRFFDLLQSDEAFVDWFSATLAEFESDACYWELPPITSDALDDETEFVLLDASRLARMPPEPEVFASHFRSKPDSDVVVFSNLGGDATLVVPSPRASEDVYPHLLSFLRGAPRMQIQSLWHVTAVTLQHELGDVPIWAEHSRRWRRLVAHSAR